MGIKDIPQNTQGYITFSSQLTFSILPAYIMFTPYIYFVYSLQSVTLTRLKSPLKARAMSNSPLYPLPNHSVLHIVTSLYVFDETEVKAIPQGKS